MTRARIPERRGDRLKVSTKVSDKIRDLRAQRDAAGNPRHTLADIAARFGISVPYASRIARNLARSNPSLLPKAKSQA